MPSDKGTERELEIAWLDDHGPYEVCMMRYGLHCMRGARSQLDYNAHFECFAGKARVLVDFLTGRRSHRTNFQATHFFQGYSAPDREHVQDIINLIDPHVSHPGKKRSVDVAGKIRLSDCEELAEWIEEALAQFLGGMPDENRKHWNDDRANCVVSVLQMKITPTTPGQSSHPTFASSSPTRRLLGLPTDPSSE